MGILYWLVAALYCNAVFAEIVYYDSYTNAVLTQEQKVTRDTQGTTYWCVNGIETCSETEGRRLDGSCNNLMHPYAGAGHSKFERLLPTYYDYVDGKSPYLKVDFSALPSSRAVRTTMLPDGSAIGPEYTQLGLIYAAFVTLDFTPTTVTDANFNFFNTTDCCTEGGSTNPMCTPIEVPQDDVLNLVAGITCLNLTRPIDFQYEGCVAADLTPRTRIQYGAASLDLKPVYGSDPQTSLVRQRLFQGGLFNYSIAADGLQWPEYIPSSPGDGMTVEPGHFYFFAILFWREHNRIAAELGKLNPSWSDEKLFETARDINIAEYTQIFYYEFLAETFGKENLVSDGVLLPASSQGGFRDVYNENVLPGWWTESLYVFRWFHSVMSSTLVRYTLEGEVFDEIKVSLSIPASELNTGKNLTYLAQGLFRGKSGKSDDKFDGYLGETALGNTPTQRAVDLASIDSSKGRSLGIAPYVEILHFCDGQDYEDFDSLSGHLDEDVIEKLKELYETDEVVDIEMMSAVWREKYYPGSKVPKTLYCLFVKQLQRNIQSDRHWYERPNRPNAFTAAQLAEVRKTSMARVLCDNIGGITETGTTARNFEPISDTNPIVSCDSLPKVDLNAWKASTATTSTPIEAAVDTVTTTSKKNSRSNMRLRRQN